MHFRAGRRKENHSGEAQGGESLRGFAFQQKPVEDGQFSSKL